MNRTFRKTLLHMRAHAHVNTEDAASMRLSHRCHYRFKSSRLLWRVDISTPKPTQGKGKAVPVQAMKVHRWNGRMVPLILNFDTIYRWSASGPGCFTPRIDPRHLVKRKFCGSRSQAGWFWRREYLSYLPILDPWAFQPVVSRCANWAIPALTYEWIPKKPVNADEWDDRKWTALGETLLHHASCSRKDT